MRRCLLRGGRGCMRTQGSSGKFWGTMLPDGVSEETVICRRGMFAQGREWQMCFNTRAVYKHRGSGNSTSRWALTFPFVDAKGRPRHVADKHPNHAPDYKIPHEHLGGVVHLSLVGLKPVSVNSAVGHFSCPRKRIGNRQLGKLGRERARTRPHHYFASAAYSPCGGWHPSSEVWSNPLGAL